VLNLDPYSPPPPQPFAPCSVCPQVYNFLFSRFSLAFVFPPGEGIVVYVCNSPPYFLATFQAGTAASFPPFFPVPTIDLLHPCLFNCKNPYKVLKRILLRGFVLYFGDALDPVLAVTNRPLFLPFPEPPCFRLASRHSVFSSPLSRAFFLSPARLFVEQVYFHQPPL